jgi:hypothetical protein
MQRQSPVTDTTTTTTNRLGGQAMNESTATGDIHASQEGTPMRDKKSTPGNAIDASLQADVLYLLGRLPRGQVGLGLNVLERMTVTPAMAVARLLGEEPPTMKAYRAALQSGGKHPLDRTREAQAVLADLLLGLGADDLLLLSRVVCRMRRTAGIAPDSVDAEEAQFYAGLDDEGLEDKDAEETGTAPDATAPRTDDVEATAEHALDNAPAPVAAEAAPNRPEDDEPMPDTLRRFSTIAARAELDNVLDALGADEVAVLVGIGKRLEMGQKTYGRLHIASDPRDFRGKETTEELSDALVYMIIDWLLRQAKEVAR